ncbi:MAG: thioredoxin [Bacillota bacterium]
MVKEINDREFVQLVQESKRPFLVDFWAPWCGPCRMTGPIVDQFAAKHSAVMDVYKMNVDQNQALAGQLGIMSIPTLLAINDGKIAKALVGYRPLAELEKELKPMLVGAK